MKKGKISLCLDKQGKQHVVNPKLNFIAYLYNISIWFDVYKEWFYFKFKILCGVRYSIKEKFWFNKYYNSSRRVKKNKSHQHISLFGKFIRKIPLYYKLQEQGWDIFINYKYNQNIEIKSVKGKLVNFLELEAKYNKLFNLVNFSSTYWPTKNKLSVYIDIPINSAIKTSLKNLDLKTIEKELGIKRSHLNYSKFQNYDFASMSS